MAEGGIMTKPQVGDIIKCVNSVKEEEHYLVLDDAKKQTSLGYPLIRCLLLNLERGNIFRYDVYYTLEYWSKVA